MNKMIEISEEYSPRDKDEIFLSEIVSEGLGMTVAVADLQDYVDWKLERSKEISS